jgi:hypothetical protein
MAQWISMHEAEMKNEVAAMKSRPRKKLTPPGPAPHVARGRRPLGKHPILQRASLGWTPDLVFALGTLGDEMIRLLEAIAVLGASPCTAIVARVERGNTSVARDLLKLEKLGWITRVGQIVDGRMTSIWALTVPL